MWDVIVAGGWLMVPLGLCSVLALAIVLERAYALRFERVLPEHALAQARQSIKQPTAGHDQGARLTDDSPLGQVLGVVIDKRHLDDAAWRSAIEDKGREVVHSLERYLNALGTIAGITPLLGLLGTVIGMIKVFQTIQLQGAGQAQLLAGGISEALVTTATGLSIAIPSYFFYRYFKARITALSLGLERATQALIEDIQDA